MRIYSKSKRKGGGAYREDSEGFLLRFFGQPPWTARKNNAVEKQQKRLRVGLVSKFDKNFVTRESRNL